MGIKGLTEPRSEKQLSDLVREAMAQLGGRGMSGMMMEAAFKHGHDLDDDRGDQEWLDDQIKKLILAQRLKNRSRVDWSKVPEVVTAAEVALFCQNPDRDSPLDIMEEE